MTDNIVDQTARDAATKAAADLDTHEAVCAERYKALDLRLASGASRMSDLKQGQDRIFGLIIAGGVATISTLAGATWWLTVTLASAVAKANGIEMP